jgi:hypothetical protein
MPRPLFHSSAGQTGGQGPKTNLELFLTGYARKLFKDVRG